MNIIRRFHCTRCQVNYEVKQHALSGPITPADMLCPKCKDHEYAEERSVWDEYKD